MKVVVKVLNGSIPKEVFRGSGIPEDFKQGAAYRFVPTLWIDTARDECILMLMMAAGNIRQTTLFGVSAASPPRLGRCVYRAKGNEVEQSHGSGGVKMADDGALLFYGGSIDLGPYDRPLLEAARDAIATEFGVKRVRFA